MLLFSRCVLFLMTLRESPCSPACCNKNTLWSIHWRMIAILTYMQLLNSLFILPVDDDDDSDLQFFFFQLLLCTTSHLLTSSRIKQLFWLWEAQTIPHWTTFDAVVGWKLKVCLCFFWLRIQAFQRSSVRRRVILMAKCPAASKRSSSHRLRCNALLHLLQHIITRRRSQARCATAKG